jgi:hypothetical protein
MCVIIICSYNWWRSNKSIHLIQNPLIIRHANPNMWQYKITEMHYGENKKGYN